MKKLFLLAAVAISFASCSTVTRTASTEGVATPIISATLADLNVSTQKIEYSYKTKASVRRGGYSNCVRTAIREALKANGDADVLVGTETTVVRYTGLFSFNKIKTVTVTGYPAKIKSFQNADKTTLQKMLENEAGSTTIRNNSNIIATKKFLGIF